MAGSGYYHDTVCLKKQIENSCSHYENKSWGYMNPLKGNCHRNILKMILTSQRKIKNLPREKFL